MTLTFPLGLLVLAGIPIVIIIYILRSKYNEQTVSSTYIWELSEKFLKRKNPLSGLTGIISLIFQILTIAFIALAVSLPIITVPDSAYDYRFVLDASASMQMEEGKGTRFELAKAEISEVIKNSYDGSTYTLVCVGSQSETVFLSVSEKETALELIGELEPSDTHGTHEALLGAAQEQFDENPSAFLYVATDKAYGSIANATLISVNGGGAENYAVTGSEYSLSAGRLSVVATVEAYSSLRELTAILTVDGTERDRVIVRASAGEPAYAELECTVSGFSEYTVSIDADDSYSLDDYHTTHNLRSDKKYSVLIVSENGFFLESVIDALADSDVLTVTPSEYSGITDKYGLYIFDSYEPRELPDGAVWLINPDESIENSGFGVRGRVSLEQSETLVKSKSTSSSVRKLLSGVDGGEIYVKSYVRYSGMYLPYHTLFSHGANPLVFAGANGLGNRQVVIGFDLHESDVALTADFIMLMRNLLDYSFPDVLDGTSYTVGEDVYVNVTSGMENLKAISPSGKEIYVDTDGTLGAFALDEVGTYTVRMTLGGTESSYPVFSAAHSGESIPDAEAESFTVTGERGNERGDGKFDPMNILFIVIAVLFIADWGVYCYEKYQLR